MLTSLKDGKEINLSAETNHFFFNKLREKLNNNTDLDNKEIAKFFEKERRRKSKEHRQRLINLNITHRKFSSFDSKRKPELRSFKETKNNLVQTFKHQGQLISQINKRKLISRSTYQTQESQYNQEL